MKINPVLVEILTFIIKVKMTNPYIFNVLVANKDNKLLINIIYHQMIIEKV